MKPNTIEIDEKGIFCYAILPHEYYYSAPDGERRRRKALEQAKRDRVYFKPGEGVNIYAMDFEHDKQYPIPDGCDVKIEGDNSCRYSKCDCASGNDCFDAYAILTPKEGISDEQIKQEAELSGVLIQPSIEEAARETNPYDHRVRRLQHDAYNNGYIAGAKSQAAEIEKLKVISAHLYEALNYTGIKWAPVLEAIAMYEQYKQNKP